MTDEHPHLTLVNPDYTTDHESEFVPLPFYPWDQRPDTLPLDHDETATALHLTDGNIPAAARLLKVPDIRLHRMLRHSPRLQRVLEEATQILVHRAAAEYAEALSSSSDRRREWGSSQIMRSRAAAAHPLAPAPPGASTASLSLNPVSKTLTFRWRTDADDVINNTHEEETPDHAG